MTLKLKKICQIATNTDKTCKILTGWLSLSYVRFLAITLEKEILMKLITFLFLTLAANAMASSIDQHIFTINGAENEGSFLLNTTQTKTAYREDSIAQTCYHKVMEGYKNICGLHQETDCYLSKYAVQICTQSPVYTCQQIPNYKKTPYTCYKTVTTSYEVPDHQVVANFNVKISRKPKEATDPSGCSVGFSMEGDIMKSHAKCIDFLILSNLKQKSIFNDTGKVTHNYDVDLLLLDAEATLAPLLGGITQMHVQGNMLTFRVGDLSKNPNFNLKLFVERKYLLKSNETLINRNIRRDEYAFNKTDEQFGLVSIDLDKLASGFNDQKNS